MNPPRQHYPDIAASDLRMPHCESGQVIGLFGGSFNPPHGGHRQVSETALQRLGIDRIWWMVTPGNPLKNTDELAPLAQRLAHCRAIENDRRVVITAFEAGISTRYTADTLAHIKAKNPGVDFIWIMGADNLAEFHHWQRWREIANTFPIAVVDRPGATLSYLSAQAAIALGRYRIDESDASLLGRMKAPVWTFLHGPRSSLSSTDLRAKR